MPPARDAEGPPIGGLCDARRIEIPPHMTNPFFKPTSRLENPDD